jgi:hypothetical protein
MINYGVDLLAAERQAHYLADGEAERRRIVARARRSGEPGLPTGLRGAGRFVKQIWSVVGPATTPRGGATVVAPSSTAIGT